MPEKNETPKQDQAARDNRSIQLNQNNDAYWRSRGEDKPSSASNDRRPPSKK